MLTNTVKKKKEKKLHTAELIASVFLGLKGYLSHKTFDSFKPSLSDFPEYFDIESWNCVA